MNLDTPNDLTQELIIDLRAYSCPMTSVYARVHLDKLAPHAAATLLIKGEVGRDNVVVLLKMLQYEISSQTLRQAGDALNSEWAVTVRKPA